MNPLFAIIPAPYRWLAIALVALALFTCGWINGNQHGTEKLTDYQAKQVLATQQVIVKQGEVTELVVNRYIEVKGKTQTVTKEVQNEVTKYVETAPRLVLDADWVRLHDRAALGAFPDPAGDADGAAGEVTAAQGLQTVTDNYGACRRNYDKLIGLQAWVAEQAKISGKSTKE